MQSRKETVMATGVQIDALVEKSTITFLGTVQRLSASTVPTYRVTSHTVVVQVNRMLKTYSAVGDLTGKNITVELTQSPGMKVGQQAIFFTTGMVYSDSIVVEEVGRLDAPKDAAANEELIAEVLVSQKGRPDRHLLSRMRTADVVAAGRVLSVRKVPRPAGQRISEHDPDWHEAVIEVQSVESGPPMKQAVLLFPASGDVRWRNAPKFSVGQEGVWILHQHQFAELRTPGYVALEPGDFHPKEQREHIRALIKRG
jgi:hypothetical protein